MKITLGYNYESLRSSLRGYYSGRGWHQALSALDTGMEHHTGLRKNGEPEFSHQVFQAQYARMLDSLFIDPIGVHITILFHDISEDHNYPIRIIEADYGPEIARSVELMTNVTESKIKKPEAVYYDQIGTDVRASVAKGIDRIHNIQSMMGTFTDEKQKSYIATTMNFPMLKVARKRFPEQEPVYHNIKHVLYTQIDLIERIHALRAKLANSRIFEK